jgi:hypothetical protein
MAYDAGEVGEHMADEQRQFVDQFMELVRGQAPPPVQATGLTVRQFVDTFVALANVPREASSPSSSSTETQRTFIDAFLRLAAEILPSAPPEDAFANVVISRWRELTWRVRGAVDERIGGLSAEQHAVIRMLEVTPSLLMPLGRSRSETSHSAMFGWALRLTTPLGLKLRGAWANLLNKPDVPLDGWSVRNEVILDRESRLDVDIVVPGFWRCMVEMKVDAGEGKDQLPRYRRHLDDYARAEEVDADLVFLTLEEQAAMHSAAPVRVLLQQVLKLWLPLVGGPEPEALVLRMWLAGVARDLCEIAGTGPAATWSFGRRVAMLDFLESVGAAVQPEVDTNSDLVTDKLSSHDNAWE